jgi:hypothetical protein
VNTVKESEVIDLDFTYGEGYVHLCWALGTHKEALCGTKKAHRCDCDSFYRPAGTREPTCPCGAPICPVCLHVEAVESR